MKRRYAVPMIRAALKNGVWRLYLNPLSWGYGVNMQDELLEKLFGDQDLDFMDRQALAFNLVKKVVNSSQIRFVNVPTAPDSKMGQIEYHLLKPRRMSLCIVYLDGEFWVKEGEFFPF